MPDGFAPAREEWGSSAESPPRPLLRTDDDGSGFPSERERCKVLLLLLLLKLASAAFRPRRDGWVIVSRTTTPPVLDASRRICPGALGLLLLEKVRERELLSLFCDLGEELSPKMASRCGRVREGAVLDPLEALRQTKLSGRIRRQASSTIWRSPAALPTHPARP